MHCTLSLPCDTGQGLTAYHLRDICTDSHMMNSQKWCQVPGISLNKYYWDRLSPTKDVVRQMSTQRLAAKADICQRHAAGQMSAERLAFGADVRTGTSCWDRCMLRDKLLGADVCTRTSCLGRCPLRDKLLGQMSAQSQVAGCRCPHRVKLLVQMTAQRQAAWVTVCSETSCCGRCPLRDKSVGQMSAQKLSAGADVPEETGC